MENMITFRYIFKVIMTLPKIIIVLSVKFWEFTHITAAEINRMFTEIKGYLTGNKTYGNIRESMVICMLIS